MRTLKVLSFFLLFGVVSPSFALGQKPSAQREVKGEVRAKQPPKVAPAPPAAEVASEEPLKAFAAQGRIEAESVRWFVWYLFIVVMVAFALVFILIALLWEPSEASKPYKATEVSRPEGFTPYRRSSGEERKGDRYVIDE